MRPIQLFLPFKNFSTTSRAVMCPISVLLLQQAYLPDHFSFSISLTNYHLIIFPSKDIKSQLLQETYTSNLTTNSPKCFDNCSIEPDYYYEAIQVNVVEDGYYSLVMLSTIDVYSSIYKNQFNPFNPLLNQINMAIHLACRNPYKRIIHLQKETTYTLVILTSHLNKTRPFSILALGPSKVTLKYISKYTFNFH